MMADLQKFQLFGCNEYGTSCSGSAGIQDRSKHGGSTATLMHEVTRASRG